MWEFMFAGHCDQVLPCLTDWILLRSVSTRSRRKDQSNSSLTPQTQNMGLSASSSRRRRGWCLSAQLAVCFIFVLHFGDIENLHGATVSRIAKMFPLCLEEFLMLKCFNVDYACLVFTICLGAVSGRYVYKGFNSNLFIEYVNFAWCVDVQGFHEGVLIEGMRCNRVSVLLRKIILHDLSEEFWICFHMS